MTYSPNLKIQRDWKSTVNVAFQQLRRILFVTADDFQFQTFDPQINWDGMTATDVVINRCKYAVIKDTFFYSINIQATLAAPFSNIVTVTLPKNLRISGRQQACGAWVLNAGVWEAGIAVISLDSNLLRFRRGANNNYTAGTFTGSSNGFFVVS